MHRSAELRIPESQYIETAEGRYKIQPITNLLALFSASAYARAIHPLMAERWQMAPWAVRATPDDADRRRLISQHYDVKNEKLISKSSAQIAQVGRFSLTIGLFDVKEGEFGSPESLVGYVQPSLVVAGNSLQQYMHRTRTPEAVKPSLRGGPELSVKIPVEDEPVLYDALYSAGVESFPHELVGISFSNSLDVYTTESDTETVAALSKKDYERVSDGVAARLCIGSPIVRMQHPDLRQITKIGQ